MSVKYMNMYIASNEFANNREKHPDVKYVFDRLTDMTVVQMNKRPELFNETECLVFMFWVTPRNDRTSKDFFLDVNNKLKGNADFCRIQSSKNCKLYLDKDNWIGNFDLIAVYDDGHIVEGRFVRRDENVEHYRKTMTEVNYVYELCGNFYLGR